MVFQYLRLEDSSLDGFWVEIENVAKELGGFILWSSLGITDYITFCSYSPHEIQWSMNIINKLNCQEMTEYLLD